MNDDNYNEIIHTLKNIEEQLKQLNKDNFLSNLYDNILAGVVSGLIVGILLLMLN